jgi:hypothetical protein
LKLTAEQYLEAAQERIEEAKRLHEDRYYGYSHYTSGLAVECVFRAYAVRNGAPFEGRHDLIKWFELARFDNLVAQSRHEKVSAAYGVVTTQWNSAHRYYSVDYLGAYFRNARLDRGIKGDPLKELSRRILESAVELVTEGKLRWTSWKQP